MKNLLIATSFGLLALSNETEAAVITWGSAQNTTATTDISTNGSLVFARAEGNSGGASATVNGVTFAGTNTLGGATGGMLSGATTGNPDFDLLLTNITSGGGAGLINYDLGDLAIGKTYEIQVFFTDQRTSFNNRVMQFASTDGTHTGATVNVAGDPNQDTSSPWGQYAIGTFTVDADGTPDLTLDPDGFGNSHLTAIQVRSIPEPSSAALIGLGGLSLILRRRK
ncbi:PEP-CTERM sorting domain-containing protein [Verrucomicrobiaceae bacterium N1E253]|uniref:PEP-CTERM sorting domain-containing protein n=1 Tax=Oceaniferula marina TaxID=2748318 RepID=A0A851GJZ9_9BACT|nr:PEP-CTERM sorting domain-containing protein [Oceaniferula marina]NWK55030.1 PEP-CTERM sorting domain-containing protein [Oceaniferula marina]